MDSANPDADLYFIRAEKWRDELKHLRVIALACQLKEELKWGKPCYTSQGRNIVLIHDFKEYCAYLFFKGALLKDPEGILIQQTKNVQAARQIRFTNDREITEMEDILKAYIHGAIEVENAGLKIEYKSPSALELPEELQKKLNEIPDLNAAFGALTPGRQRAYALYFSAPKQVKTRESRIEKCMQQIRDGKGLND